MNSTVRSRFLKHCLCWILLGAGSIIALDRQSNSDYHTRRVALSRKLNGGAAVVFAGTEAEGPSAIYGFRQDNNFFYLSGSTEPGAALLVAPEVTGKDAATSQPYTEVLFLPARNLTQEKWTGVKLGPENAQASSITGFDKVENLDKLPEYLGRLYSSGKGSLYLDMPEAGEQNSASNTLDWLRRTNTVPAGVAARDVKPALAELRTIKDAGEVERIRHAAEASVAAHFSALGMLKPGLIEHDIAARMQYEFMKRGCERPAYAPIVGAGPNATVLHYSADDGPIKSGDVVVMDVAGEYAMYASDLTRTAPANGKFTVRQREIYDIVLAAQRAAIDAFVPGLSTMTGKGPNSLYQVAYDYINTHGKDLHGQPLGQYFIHGLGHFVGLEVHDVGDTKARLDRGMVFTIEPGIYIPEEKIGVRIEDLFWVDESGRLVNLTGALPHSADDIEAVMAGTYKARK